MLKNLQLITYLRNLKQSMFRMKKINDEKEFKILIKTIEAIYDRIEKVILEHHVYEVPQIIVLDIKHGYFKYLE